MIKFNELIEAVVAKFGGEFSSDSAVWAQATNTTVDYELTIPTNWVFYLTKVSGYANGGDVRCTFYDQDNIPRWEWTEFIDTNTDFEIVPFLEKSYKGTIKFSFNNTSGANRSVGFVTTGILIPETNRIEFEKAIKESADLIPLLRKIAEELTSGVEEIKTVLIQIRNKEMYPG